MGYTKHDAVIVTTWQDAARAAVEAYRKTMPKRWQRLLAGPLPAVTNGIDTYVFAPDGSKEGWDDSDEGEVMRDGLIAALAKPGVYANVVTVEFGGDFGADQRPRAVDASPVNGDGKVEKKRKKAARP